MINSSSIIIQVQILKWIRVSFYFTFILFLVFAVFTLPLSAAKRGIKRVEIKTTSGEIVGLYEESHALVIGVSDYTAGWPKLPGVRDDIVSVRKVLEEQGFGVEVVENPKNREELEQTFNQFIRKHGRNPENRLLFYFAGHGHTEKTAYGEEMGYIVPTTSPNPNRDRDGFLDTAMDMQQVEVFAKRIQSKHALFIFDSCFSGSIFALSRAIPKNISYKTARPVRQFITSGSADEEVPDVSVFSGQFVSALRGEGDSDKDGYVTAVELGEFLQRQVVNYSKGAQHPQYGKIRNPNLDKGDFVFVLPKAALDLGSTSKTAVSVAVVAAPPQTSGLQLETLIKQAESQEQAKEKLKEVKTQWASWQSRMQKDFNYAQNFESRDITPDIKIEPWRQFLEEYASNNPFGKKDETLRSKAQGRLKYWRSENKLLAQKNADLASGSASVDLSNTPEISAPPANPDAEKIWNKYKLGLKRNLPKIAEKYLRKLLNEHPESSYAIQMKVAELQALLKKHGLTTKILNEIKALRAKHPRNPDLLKLLAQAAPLLLKNIDEEIKTGRLDSAEKILRLVSSWNVSGMLITSNPQLTTRRKKIQQERIVSFVLEAKKQRYLGNAQLAESSLNAALSLGADPGKIEALRRVFTLKFANILIESGKFEEAGEMLLELELEGKYANELPGLYTALQKAQIQQRWDGILDLINQKQFSKAEKQIEGWEIENAPSKLTKLKNYFIQQKGAHEKQRREKVRRLIENNKFPEANRELSQWNKTGEDLSELLKLTAYLRKQFVAPPGTVFDISTGLMWQKKPDGVRRTWKEAKRYCRDLSLGGYSNWELPNKIVLADIFSKKEIFDSYEQSSFYWSSTNAGGTRNYALGVYFSVGQVDSGYVRSSYLSRCVRHK